MNEVKKLARLLRDMDLWAYNTSFEKQAEFLIANGVRVVGKGEEDGKAD